MKAGRYAVSAVVVLICSLTLVTHLEAQSLTRRSPNLYGTWVTSPWNLFFSFNPRFRIIGDEDITGIFDEAFLKNSPTFNLALGLWSPFMARCALLATRCTPAKLESPWPADSASESPSISR